MPAPRGGVTLRARRASGCPSGSRDSDQGESRNRRETKLSADSTEEERAAADSLKLVNHRMLICYPHLRPSLLSTRRGSQRGTRVDAGLVAYRAAAETRKCLRAN